LQSDAAKLNSLYSVFELLFLNLYFVAVAPAGQIILRLDIGQCLK